MKKRLLSLVMVLTMASATLLGCSGGAGEAETDGEKTVIKLGTRADMVNQLEAVRDEIEALGYTVEETIFDDSIQPDVALAEGSIDINWYQHEPYLESYNAENGTDLVMIEPKTFLPLFAVFSNKWESLDELPEGAIIGFCNDATNQARGLKLLERQGLLKLDDSVEVPTIYDVVENPHNFEFIEAEMSVLPQSLPDVDAICLAAGHMINAGLSAEKYLCMDDDETYAVGFAVRAEDKDAEWAKDIAEAVQCDDLVEYFKVEKAGTQVPLWN